MTELLYLVQAEEEEGSALQSSLPREEPPLFPISIQHQSLHRDCEWAPGQPPVMCIYAFSQTRTISVPNRRRTNYRVRNNKYPVSYPASLPKWILNVQTRTLHIFTHAPDWRNASFPELVERAGKNGLQQKQGFFSPTQKCFVIEKMLFWNFPVFGELLLLTLHNFISVHWHHGKYIFYPSLIFTKRFFSPSPSILKARTVLNSHSWCARSWKHQRCLSMLYSGEDYVLC